MSDMRPSQVFKGFLGVLVIAVAGYAAWFTATHRQTAEEKALLSAWPLRRSAGWLAHVNSPQTETELAAIRHSVQRGSPFGDEHWATTATKKLGLEITTRPQGRPRLK